MVSGARINLPTHRKTGLGENGARAFNVQRLDLARMCLHREVAVHLHRPSMPKECS